MRLIFAVPAFAALFLGGCATSTVSTVAVVNQLPSPLVEATYAIDHGAGPSPGSRHYDTRGYEGMVRGELNRLGWREAPQGTTPDVRVSLALEGNYSRTTENSMGFSIPDNPNSGSFSPRIGPPPVLSHTTFAVARLMTVTFRSGVDGQQLYQVAVHNVSDEPRAARIMPALVASAFDGFPVRHGVVRSVPERF